MTNRFPTAESTAAIRRWWAPAIALAVLAALFPAPPADAEARKAARPAQAPEATAPREAGEAIMAIVSIKSQKVTIYDADGWILRAPVSTGQKGHETPAGVFAVVEKNKDHRSNLYDDAWMPHMLRVTWNGIALHGGPLPGHPASKGCVRLPFGFAEKLFDKMRINTRIIISPNDAEPVAFSHPALFVPNPEAARGCADARRNARPRGGRGRPDGQAGEERRRHGEARDGVAHGVAAQAGTGATPGAKAELAAAEKRLAAAKTDQARAKAEEPAAEGSRKGRGAAHAARHRQGQREGEARRGRSGPGQRQGGREEAGRHGQSSARGQARARAGLGVHQPRDAEALRSAQHA